MKGLSGLVILLVIFSVGYCSSKESDELQTETIQHHAVQPFIDTEAEKWAFDLQMTRILNGSQEKIQDKARSFIFKRDQNHAQVQDQTVPVVLNGPDQEDHYKVYLKDGVITGLETITFNFEKILSYEDLDVVFMGEVKYPNGLKVIQSFIATTNDTIMGNGKTTAYIDILRFSLTARLYLKFGSIQVENLERDCRSIVKVNFEGYGPMELPLVQKISKVTKKVFADEILKDVQKLTLTAMEGAFERMEGNIELPQYDYGKDYTLPGVFGHTYKANTTRCSKKLMNPTVMRATIRTSSVGINYPENLPFIQNDPEMRSFFELLRIGMQKYLNDIIEKTVKTLHHRGLQLAKLTDIRRTFIGGSGSDEDPVGSLNITDGWISDITNISRGGMDFVYIDQTEIHISAKLHLPNKIEVNQAYHLDLGSYKGAGGLLGTTEYMIYMAKISVNLNTFETKLLDLYLICLGQVKYQVAVIETKDSSYEVGLLKAAVESFNFSVSSEIGKLIRHSLEYAISHTDVKEYIPPWDYTRVCDRKGNLDPKYRMCEKADKDLALRKKHGNDHHASVKSNPVHFINTDLELQAFEKQLLVSMNNYMRKLIDEASRIISLQDMKKIKYKYYVRPWNAKDPQGMYRFGTVSIFGGILEDLSAMFQGTHIIDHMEFDDNSMVLSAQIPFWWILMFQANASIIQDSKLITTKIKGELSSLIYHVEIRVDDYKKVTIKDFSVECLGDGRFWTKFSYDNNWMRESLMEHLNGFLAQHIWPEANQILKRSFEDAVNSINISAFLPVKNYGARENLPTRAKTWDGFKSCGDFPGMVPTVEAKLDKIKVVEFEKVLPLLKSEVLRRKLDSDLKERSHSYLNHIWSLTKNRVSKVLAFGHPAPKRISFYPESLGGEQEAILNLNDGWFKIFSNNDLPYHLYVRDTAYGENSSFIILLTEDIEMFKVAHNFTLQISDERVNGTIVMSAEGIRNFLTSQFFIVSNRLEMVDYDLFCVNHTIVSITGLPSDYNGLKTVIMAEAIKASLAPLYKDYLVEMMDAFDEVVRTYKDEIQLLPEFILEKHLFGVAMYHDPDPQRHMKRNRLAIQCLLEEEPDMIELMQFPPFIGTAAEWTFFSKSLVNSMNALKDDLTYSSLKYIILNEFNEIPIPDMNGEIKIEDSHEVKVPTKFTAINGTMKYLFKSTTPEKIYFDEVADEVVLLAYLNFKDIIELHYDIEVNSMVNNEVGEIKGVVEDLIYSFKVHIHLGKKHFRLESLQLKCVKGINMKIAGISYHPPQLEEQIINSLRKTFMTTILDNLEKILTIPLLQRVMQLNDEDNGNFYVPVWNYDKDYNAAESDGMFEDFDICPTKVNFFQGSDGLIFYNE
ncbi:uncharacterized protein [Hetaerina americana]|uniref:uncharacterized protein n=1 Tax=Hetaerina americana TaxID=62018 RepID=UPI003A7F3274